MTTQMVSQWFQKTYKQLSEFEWLNTKTKEIKIILPLGYFDMLLFDKAFWIVGIKNYKLYNLGKLIKFDLSKINEKLKEKNLC